MRSTGGGGAAVPQHDAAWIADRAATLRAGPARAGEADRARLLDGTILRLPRVRITDRNGEPMEMHPRPVDVEVKRPIGESYGTQDTQLDKAVEVLLAGLKTTKRQ